MVVRKIVKIQEEKCNGCGECLPSCSEGALQIVNGKARLVDERYCDGLGDCLGTCPQGAISVVEREADEFDAQAVEEHLRREEAPVAGCPGMALQDFGGPTRTAAPGRESEPGGESALTQWPVQMELVPPAAPFFDGADLLLAADCVPFAMDGFHGRLLRGRKLLVGCPKLDDAGRYVEKLTRILQAHELSSLTVVHMEVPCCHGLMAIVEKALAASRSEVPVRGVVVGIQGALKDRQKPAGSGGAR